LEIFVGPLFVEETVTRDTGCRYLRSGGTRIRTGDTMIFSPAKGHSPTLMGVQKPLR
jgi:hypothetical protein